MNTHPLTELLVHELECLYDAERQVQQVLPRMIESASIVPLRSAFELHLSQSKGQLERLEEIFPILDTPVQKRDCGGISGLIDDALHIAESKQGAELKIRDFNLVIIAQKLKAHKAACYNSTRLIADALHADTISIILQDSFDEEEEGAIRLSLLTDTVIEECLKASRQMQAADVFSSGWQR